MSTALRDALRSLRRSPGLSVLIVLIVAGATAVNIAVFNAVNHVLLEALPVMDAERVFVLGEQEPRPLGEVPLADIQDWARLSGSFAGIAAMGSSNWDAVLTSPGEPTAVRYRAVSGSWFDVLGMRAALGRTLSAADDRLDAAPAAVISHGLWERLFGADRSPVGRTIGVGDGAHTIVGVLPRGFQYPRGADMWLPLVPEIRKAGLRLKLDLIGTRQVGFLFAVGRLNSGVTAEQARVELDTIIAQLGAEYGRKTEGRAGLVPILDDIFGPARPALWALLAGAALVLVIAWANVVGLLIARSADHGRDLAVRAALGASRPSLMASVAAESLVLAAAGTLVGLFLGALVLPVVLRLAPDVPRLADARSVDATAALFAFALAAVTGTVCGVLPARHLLREDVATTLAVGSARSGSGLERRRLRRALTAGQIAVAFTLLIAVSLFGRSVRELQRLDVGFATKGVLAATVVLPDWRYPTIEEQRRFHELLAREIETLPGVEAVGAVYIRPLRLAVGLDSRFTLEGQSEQEAAKNPWTNWESVTSGYFRAMRIPLVRGRFFTDDDRDGTPQVAIVSEGFARAAWSGKDPVGQRIRTYGGQSEGMSWFTIVGVVGDVRYRELTGSRFDVYVPARQAPSATSDLMVRASGDPAFLIPTIRAIVRRMDAQQIVSFTIMEHAVNEAARPWRFNFLMFGLLAGVGVVLAAAGLYAALSRGVSERAREIGIRKALGATDAGIGRLIGGESAALVLTGMAVGALIAAALMPAIGSLLFGIRPLNAPAFALASALVVVVTFASTAAPVYRASRLDPSKLLRLD